MSPYGNLWARFLGAKNVLAAVSSCQHVTDVLYSQYDHEIFKSSMDFEDIRHIFQSVQNPLIIWRFQIDLDSKIRS